MERHVRVPHCRWENFGSGFLTTQEPKVKFFWGKIGKPHNNLAENSWQLVKTLLLMQKILHQLICSLSDYLQIFIHPRWCRISSINSATFNGFLAIIEIHSQRDKKSMFVSQDESSSDFAIAWFRVHPDGSTRKCPPFRVVKREPCDDFRQNRGRIL